MSTSGLCRGGRIYYFGDERVGGRGSPGHFLHRPWAAGWAGLSPPIVSNAGPWTEAEAEGLAGDPARVQHHGEAVPSWGRDDQPQGVVRLVYRSGWTAIAFWDRTGDERFGSSTTIVAEGEHDLEGMLRLFAEHFPIIWERCHGPGLVPHHRNPALAPRLRVEAQRLRIAEDDHRPAAAVPEETDDAAQETPMQKVMR